MGNFFTGDDNLKIDFEELLQVSPKHFVKFSELLYELTEVNISEIVAYCATTNLENYYYYYLFLQLDLIINDLLTYPGGNCSLNRYLG